MNNGSDALAPPKEDEAKATIPKFGSGALVTPKRMRLKPQFLSLEVML